MGRFHFEGMMAPNLTPMKEDGSLNLSIIPAYARFLRENGVTGVWVNGTSGEGMSLTVAERKQVAEAWLGCRADVATVIVQCGGSGCLMDTQDLARHAVAHGASGVAVLPSLFDRPASVDELLDYLEEVAKACPDTPLFYYHIPMKTGVELSMSELLTKGARRIPTLAGLKFTDHDVSGEGRRCLAAEGGAFTVFSGFDQRLQEALSVGFTSAVNGCFNFLPQPASRIFSLMREGRTEEAKAIQDQITSYLDVIFKQTGGFSVACFKTACSLLTNLDMGPARLPVKPFTPTMTTYLRNDLKNLGLTVY